MSDAIDRLDLGRLGEQAALGVYTAKGYRSLARNWRCALGELDLVLIRGRVVAFCEVKTRRGDPRGLGAPFEAVTASKQRRLRSLAAAFLAASAAPAIRRGVDVRFDVASVTVRPGGRPAVHLFEDAF